MSSNSSNQQCRKGRTLKRWVVVIFKETKEYSVIPINWLNLDFNLEDLTPSNIALVQHCQWPPFKVTSVELMNADDPDGTWKSYKIKILDSKIYVNFKLAWHKQVEIEFSSTENEQEAPKKKKIRMQSLSSDESDIEDGGYSIMSVNSRKPCESEYYEPSQYIELHVNKVPAAQNSTKPTSGSIGDNEFSTNRIINQLNSTPQTPNVTDTQFEPIKYPELEVSNVAAIYNQQISVLPADQNPTTSNSSSIDNEFSPNTNINQDCYTKKKKGISEVSSKYFKQLLKTEQKKFGKCTERENLNLISTSILPTIIKRLGIQFIIMS